MKIMTTFGVIVLPVAIDTGVRHDGELNRLSPSMINWKTKN